MRYKILNFEEYVNYFQFNEIDTCFGIEYDPDAGEHYMAMQTFLPKDSIYEEPADSFLRFLSSTANIPDRVLVKFELFALGTIENLPAFIFKPWVLNVSNYTVCESMEKFHLFVPSYLFYHLLDKFIFLEQFTWEQIKDIRVINDIENSKVVDLTNGNGESDFSPFSKIRKMNLNEVENNFQNTFDVINPNLDIKPIYMKRFQEYFQ